MCMVRSLCATYQKGRAIRDLILIRLGLFIFRYLLIHELHEHPKASCKGSCQVHFHSHLKAIHEQWYL